jgi:c(7)-type cytochrome triheme protein
MSQVVRPLPWAEQLLTAHSSWTQDDQEETETLTATASTGNTSQHHSIPQEAFPMRKIISFVVLAVIVGAGAVMAVPSGKVLEFKNSPLGAVQFDGAVHSKAAASCKDCHNDGMFPKMKQGTVKITMDQIYAGQLCGTCHNGKKAFDAKANCKRCHK